MQELTITQMKQIYIQLHARIYWGEKVEHRELNHAFKKVDNGLVDYYLIFSHNNGSVKIHYLNFGNTNREMVVPDNGLTETFNKYINE